MSPYSGTLAWKIPWAEEPGRLQSMGSLRVGHDWATSFSLFTFMHWRRKWQPTPVFLPEESQEQEPGGLPSMWSYRVGHDWSNLAAAAAAQWYRTKPVWLQVWPSGNPGLLATLFCSFQWIKVYSFLFLILKLKNTIVRHKPFFQPSE